MLFLKQSTAVTVNIGPFIDDTDGKTAETGLTEHPADILLSKNGGDFAAKNEASNLTHDNLGWYHCPLDTTDTNTLGRLQLHCHEAGFLPVFHEYMVLPANIYDSLVSGSASDYLDVSVVQFAGTTATAADASGIIKDIHDTDLPDVHTDVGTAITNIGDVHATDLPALKTVVDDIHNTDLPAVKTDTGAIHTVVDDLHDTDLPAVHTHAAAADTQTVAGTIGDAVLDEVIENGKTLRQMTILMFATQTGKSGGGGTNTLTFQDNADTKARITATVDADGNRTAMVLDAT